MLQTLDVVDSVLGVNDLVEHFITIGARQQREVPCAAYWIEPTVKLDSLEHWLRCTCSILSVSISQCHSNYEHKCS